MSPSCLKSVGFTHAEIVIPAAPASSRLLADSSRDSARLRRMAELRLENEPIPPLHGLRADRERIRAATERLLAAERADAKELKRLAKNLKEVRDTTLWGLLVDLMQADTAKHITILSFIRDRADAAIT